MNKNILTAAIISLGMLVACNSTKTPESSANGIDNQPNINKQGMTANSELKEIAINGLDAFLKDYDEEAAKIYFKEDYIQHNPSAPDGLSASLQMIPMLKEAKTYVTTPRILQDGEYVVMHNTLHNASLFGGDAFVVFDVYRMEDGMIAEHWDAMTPMVESTFGNTQVDGETEITDLDKTEENKKLVRDLVTNVFIKKEIARAPEFFSADYIEHNPISPGGVDNLMEGFKKYADMGIELNLIKLHKVLGEGNFVLAMIEASMNGQPTIIYDLYRIEGGKVVEHWDVIQAIPEQKANDNGVF